MYRSVGWSCQVQMEVQCRIRGPAAQIALRADVDAEGSTFNAGVDRISNSPTSGCQITHDQNRKFGEIQTTKTSNFSVFFVLCASD